MEFFWNVGSKAKVDRHVFMVKKLLYSCGAQRRVGGLSFPMAPITHMSPSHTPRATSTNSKDLPCEFQGNPTRSERIHPKSPRMSFRNSQNHLNKSQGFLHKPQGSTHNLCHILNGFSTRTPRVYSQSPKILPRIFQWCSTRSARVHPQSPKVSFAT